MNDTNTQATQEAAEFVERLQFEDLPAEALRTEDCRDGQKPRVFLTLRLING